MKHVEENVDENVYHDLTGLLSICVFPENADIRGVFQKVCVLTVNHSSSTCTETEKR